MLATAKMQDRKYYTSIAAWCTFNMRTIFGKLQKNFQDLKKFDHMHITRRYTMTKISILFHLQYSWRLGF